MKKTKEEFDIRDIISVFVPKLWIIIVCALVFALALGAYSAFIKTDTYSSTATMLVANDATLNGTVLDVSTAMVERCEIVIFSDIFIQKVIKDIKESNNYNPDWKLSVSYVKSVITMKQLGDTEYFSVTVTTEDSKLSYAIASQISENVVSDLPDSLPYDPKYIRTRTTNAPVPAISPDSKHTARNTLIGFVAGAALSMIAIFVYSIFDVTIRDKKKIEDNFDIPVLGVIPRFLTEEGTDR